MIQNYLKIALRNLNRFRSFAFINIIGLTMGMTCCFMILLFVRNELSFDTFHEKFDRIYRITYNPKFAELPTALAVLPPPVAPLLPGYFPQMETAARMYRRNASMAVNQGDIKKSFEEENFFFADSSILQIFSFAFLKGDPKTALNETFTVILTEQMEKKYFGSQSALGQTILFGGLHPMKVTGVVKEFPDNSHIHFNFISNYQTMFALENPEARENLPRNWIISHSFTYVLLKPNQNPASVNARFPQFLLDHAPKQFSKDIEYQLQPMRDFHLRSNLGGEAEAPGNITYLYVFTGVAFITLLIACINFVNLSTARSLKRAKEVGMRKVLGAERKHLIQQFLGESFLLASIAFLCSFILIQLFLPVMNTLTGKHLSFSTLLNDPILIPSFIGIFLITSLLAGSYPAFFVSAFQPITTLKGSYTSEKAKGGILRQALVVVQFAASIGLIIAASIAFNQLHFMRNQPLGFEKDYIITAPLFSQNLNNIFLPSNDSLYQKIKTFRNVLKQNPSIEEVTLSSQALGQGSTRRGIVPEGFTKEDNKFIACLAVDYNFLKTYNMKLLAGRDFSENFETDKEAAFLITETGAKSFGWTTPAKALGKTIDREGKQGKIIGVIQDFHAETLSQPLEGVLIDVDIPQLNLFSIKISSSNVPQTLSFLEKKWSEYFPEKAFEYDFLDTSIARQYESDQRLGNIISYFAGLVVLISCLGLYGLISLVAQQKVKEIGIRKVLGASISQIVILLSKDFIKLVLISFVIAAPVAWYFMNKWLQGFAFRIDISWWIFLLAGILAMIVAQATVSYQAIRAARANPVKSLRSE
ncbi:ABC transporter permease [Cytophagaceae bacterium DM2B3-1]|uniref:ABC transporter permease n=1 Tax=Xanthocytophaga flava TaxID=3048013 RepID=A0ABT7CJP0_9BACT|nr:ABC transporter permease [Xanthocytophaga flavus]MDJ1467865.1 ABC transporter permease [Xanthocytophaga flavus]MDJ1493943.1 ABC transporter permease [Xanthocytophaga flavus]